MTAIFKNGGRKNLENAKNGILEILVPYNIYIHTQIVSLDETVINVRRNKFIFKMTAKSIWDQKVKMETTVFKLYIIIRRFLNMLPRLYPKI